MWTKLFENLDLSLSLLTLVSLRSAAPYSTQHANMFALHEDFTRHSLHIDNLITSGSTVRRTFPYHQEKKFLPVAQRHGARVNRGTFSN